MKSLPIPILAVAFALILAGSALAAPSAEATMDTVLETIKAEQAGMKKGTAWQQEEAALLEQLRQARLEGAWYATQERIFSGYVDSAERRVEELESRRDNLARIEAQLEGELLTAFDALLALVHNDLPFAEQERQDRLNFLQQSLADYDLTSAEKLRRLLEGLQAELSYSKDLESLDTTIEVDGQQHLVKQLRLGRIALYALAIDGSQAWIWSDGGYRPLSQDDRQALQAALKMTAERSFTQLPVLPVITGAGGVQ